jgi:GT2 family glycosyltransferase
MTAAPRLSVVVVSMGRPRALMRCLTALSQSLSCGFETIVVADAEGLAAARALPVAPRLRLLPQPVPNIAAARNAGIAAAAGEVIAFIDDDAVPEPTWVEALRAAFTDPLAIAATGPVLGRNGISLQWGRMASDGEGRDRWLPPDAAPAAGEVIKLHGTNMAVRRAALCDLGGFDPAFAFYLDDTDLARRLSALPGHSVFVEGAVVHHGFAASARRNADRLPLDLTDVGASSAVFLRKHAAADRVAPALDALREAQRRRLLRLARRRKLDAGAMRHLMETLEAGIAAGRDRCSARIDLPTDPGGFRPLRKTLPPEMTVLSGWRHRAARLRAAAGRLIAADRPCTVLIFEPTPRKLRVEFTDGGWWEHRGGLYGPADRCEHRLQLWRFEARVRAEFGRVSHLRGID